MQFRHKLEIGKRDNIFNAFLITLVFVTFTYNDNNGTQIVTGYDAWLDHCGRHVLSSFNFLVKKKVDVDF